MKGVVKSGRNGQREIDFWSSFRKLFNVHLTLEIRTESQFCVSVGCDGFRKSVSGRIDSSVLSLFLLRCSFSLALSPSFRLSLSLSLSFRFSPSFLPSDVTSSSGDALRTNRCYAVTVRILCS